MGYDTLHTQQLMENAMDKEILAVIGQLYLENLALRNMIDDLKKQQSQKNHEEQK